MIWPFHRHKWRVLSASCDGREHYHSLSAGFSLLTAVVVKCECGKIKNLIFAWNHTLENLRGEETEIERILKTIK